MDALQWMRMGELNLTRETSTENEALLFNTQTVTYAFKNQIKRKGPS